MKQIIALLFWGIYHSLLGQTIDMQLIGSMGGHYTLSNGIEYAYSVGEPIVETYQQSNSVITQGFHQPLVFNPSHVRSFSDDELCTVYPIPADQTIQIQFDQIMDRTIQIESILGQVLSKQRSNQNLYQFLIDRLPAASYIIRSINHQHQTITTLTFIKY